MTYLLNKLNELFNWLADKLQELADWFLQTIRYLFREFLTDLVDFIFGLIDSALGALSYNPNLQPFSHDLLCHVNYFFPLNEFFAVLLLLFTAWLTISGLKLLFKALPWSFGG